VGGEHSGGAAPPSRVPVEICRATTDGNIAGIGAHDTTDRKITGPGTGADHEGDRFVYSLFPGTASWVQLTTADGTRHDAQV
jgi:hypothetical protein